MSDVETPPITESDALAPGIRVAGSLLDRWVQTDPKVAIERVETMVKVLEQLRVASIRATYPSDWIIHTSVDGEGTIIKQVGYLQDTGAERAGKVWGIEVGKPVIEREDFPDGTFCYHMLADAWSKVTGERIDYAEGTRWSGDSFFARQVKNEGDRVDPTDVRKAAYANLHGRAVRSLAGLNGVPIETLRQAGLDTARVVHVSYGKGAKGGESTGASVGGADVVVAFGNSKGQKPAELADKDLDWYVKAYAENVADPGKAKFAKANQRVLDALKAEKERRTQAAAHEAETGTTKAGGESKRADVYTRLRDVTKGDQAKIAAVIRASAKEWGVERGSLSDLTEDELDKLLRVPDDVLANLVKVATK